jgi:hypothetical protein
MFAVIESLAGTVQQVVVYKTHKKAIDCFKRFAKQNNVEVDDEAIDNEQVDDSNGYELKVIKARKGD